MTQKRIILILCLCFGFLANTKAQDAHYTQFYHSPMFLNPGLTGNIDGDFRVNLMYRTQWTMNGFKGYNTMALGVDGPLKFVKMGNKANVTAGLYIMNDRSGDAVLNNMKFDIPIGFQYNITDEHKIGLGLQPTYFMRSVNQAALKFASQFDENIQDFNSTFLSFENFTGNRFGKFDMSAGMHYTGQPHSKIGYEIGGAFQHLIQPKESFIDGSSNKLPMRMTVHAGLDLGIGKNAPLHIQPKMLYQTQAGAKEMVVGGLLAYHLNPLSPDDIEIFAGVTTRLGDAMHYVLGAEWKGVRLGMSYDYNTSSLKELTNGFGAVELGLLYVKSLPKAIPPKTVMPCIRFY